MRILWIPHSGWHIPQRAHIFCRALAERHEVHVTDWVADFTAPRDYLSARYVRNFFYRRYRDGAITVHGVPRISPALCVPALRRWNTAVFARLLERLIGRYRIDVAVGTFVAPPPAAPRLVFDLFDDNPALWRDGGGSEAYAAEIERIENLYLRRAAAVVAASSVLVEKARVRGRRGPVWLIPNGVDLQRFDRAEGTAIRRQLRVHGRLVGVVGNHDKAGELRKVLAAAEAFTGEEVTFLIAGRGRAVPAAQAYVRRARLAQVKFLAPVPLEMAPDVVAALDVGLCPYVKSPGAEAQSPMRLFAYTAAGLPTVCTDLEAVRRLQLPNVVLVEDAAAALAEGIRRALQMPRVRPRQIVAYDLPRLVRRYEAVLMGRALDDDDMEAPADVG